MQWSYNLDFTLIVCVVYFLIQNKSPSKSCNCFFTVFYNLHFYKIKSLQDNLFSAVAVFLVLHKYICRYLLSHFHALPRITSPNGQKLS